MAVKIFFIGNSLMGDDGIGPYLYEQLKDEQTLKSFKMYGLGTIGLDIISYVEKEDKLIIVDAVYSDKDTGQVVLLNTKDLTHKQIVSTHDIGFEQTAAILSLYMPKLKINVIGIKVRGVNKINSQLSKEIIQKIHKIKKEVLSYIHKVAKEI